MNVPSVLKYGVLVVSTVVMIVGVLVIIGVLIPRYFPEQYRCIFIFTIDRFCVNILQTIKIARISNVHRYFQSVYGHDRYSRLYEIISAASIS